jgi:hypothetical protein
MVWLIQSEVTLADGSTQKVLVPQVYALARAGDLFTTGALLSGNIVNLDTAGDLNVSAGHASAYAQMNPTQLVPRLVDGDHAENAFGQSLVILEYLEETHPTPALLPTGTLTRARVRAMAQTITSEVHPLNNLRVLQYLKQPLHVNATAKTQWYRH